MENKVSTHKKLVWAIIALALLNLATISTVFWRMYNDDHGMFEMRHHERHGETPDKMKYFIKEKLNFSDEQFSKFVLFDSVFRMQSKLCFEKMEQLRGSMLNELTSEKPDTAKLMDYSNELGQQHILLKKHLMEMYLNTRNICTTLQQRELSMIFKNLIAREGMQPPHAMERKTGDCKGPRPE